MNKQFNICQAPFVYFMASGLKKKNPKEARELSHRCEHRLVAKIKGSDFKELGKTCHNAIKRMDVAERARNSEMKTWR